MHERSDRASRDLVICRNMRSTSSAASMKRTRVATVTGSDSKTRKKRREMVNAEPTGGGAMAGHLFVDGSGETHAMGEQHGQCVYLGGYESRQDAVKALRAFALLRRSKHEPRLGAKNGQSAQQRLLALPCAEAPAAAEAADADDGAGVAVGRYVLVAQRGKVPARGNAGVSAIASASAAAEAESGAGAARATDSGSSAMTRRWLGWLGVVPSETQTGRFDAVIRSPAGVHVAGSALKDARSAAVAYDLAASRVHGRKGAMLNFAPRSSIPAPGQPVSSGHSGRDRENCATGVVFGDRIDPAPFPGGGRDLNSASASASASAEAQAQAQAVSAAGTGSFTEQMLLQQGDRIIFAFQQGKQAGVVSKGKLWRNVMFDDGVAVKVNLNLALHCDTPHELPEGHWCFDHAFAVREAERVARDSALVEAPSVQTSVSTGDDASGKAKIKVATPAKGAHTDARGLVPVASVACRPRTLKRADGQLGIAQCALRFAAPRRRDVDTMPIVPFVDASKSPTPQRSAAGNGTASESKPRIEPLAVLSWADAQRKCICAALLSDGPEGHGVAVAHAAKKLSVMLAARRLRPPLTAGSPAATGNGKKGQVTVMATADTEDGVFYFENVSLGAAGLWELTILPSSKPNANPMQRRWESYFVAGATIRCEVLERVSGRSRSGSRNDWYLLTRHPLLLPCHGGYAQAVKKLPDAYKRAERVTLCGEAKTKAKQRVQARGEKAHGAACCRTNDAAEGRASASGPTSPDVGNLTGSRKRGRGAGRGNTPSARRRPRKDARPRRIHPQMLVVASSTTDQHKSSADGAAAKQQARRKRYKPFAFEDLNGAGDTYTIFSKYALYQQLYTYAGGIRKKHK